MLSENIVMCMEDTVMCERYHDALIGLKNHCIFSCYIEH